MKIAFVGTNLAAWAEPVVRDLLAVPEFAEIHIALADDLASDERERVADRIRAQGPGATVQSTDDPRAALDGARYVFMRWTPTDPAGHSPDRAVVVARGLPPSPDAYLGAEGIFLAQRTIPDVLELCRDLHEVADRDALLVDLTPGTANVWAAAHAGEVAAVGLRPDVDNAHARIAKAMERRINGNKQPGARGYRPVAPRDVDVTAAGVHPVSWFVRVLFEGEDWTDRLPDVFAISGTTDERNGGGGASRARDVLFRFGYYPAATDAALAASLPAYRTTYDPTEETAPAPEEAENAMRPPGSRLVEALETGRTARVHIHSVNDGTVDLVADDVVVEAPAYIDRHGLSTPPVGLLPTACAAVCGQLAGVRRLTVEAAVEGDTEKLMQALMLDAWAGASADPSTWRTVAKDWVRTQD